MKHGSKREISRGFTRINADQNQLKPYCPGSRPRFVGLLLRGVVEIICTEGVRPKENCPRWRYRRKAKYSVTKPSLTVGLLPRMGVSVRCRRRDTEIPWEPGDCYQHVF